MKKLISTALSLVIICTAFSCVGFTAGAADAVEPQNGIISPIGSDSGFEDENAFIPNMRNSDFLTISESDKHSGAKSLKYTSDNNWREVGAATFAVEKNTDYIISFWSKGGDSWGANPNYNVYKAALTAENTYTADKNAKLIGTNNIFVTNDPNLSDTKWKINEELFNSGDAEYVQLYFDGAHNDICFDDVYIRKNDALVGIDGGYEGDVSAMPDLRFPEQTTVVEDTAGAHSGSKYLKVTGTGDAGVAAFHTIADKSYTVSFWYKNGGDWSSLNIHNGTKTAGKNGAGGNIGYLHTAYGSGEHLVQFMLNRGENLQDGVSRETWKYGEILFTAKSDITVMAMQGDTAGVCIDDIYLEKADKAVKALGEVRTFEYGENGISVLNKNANCITVSEETAHSGKNSLKAVKGTSANGDSIFAAFNTVAGSQYGLIFWSKGGMNWASVNIGEGKKDSSSKYSNDKNSIQFFINRKYGNGNGDYLSQAETDEWHKSEIRFTAASNITTLQFQGLSDASAVYLDDMVLHCVDEYYNSNLITNGNFDYFTQGWYANDWSYNTSGGPTQSRGENETDLSYCLNLKCSNNWYPNLGTPFAAEKDTNYKLTLKYKGSSNGSFIAVYPTDEKVDNLPKSAAVYEKDLGNSDGWCELEICFNSGSEMTDKGVFAFKTAPNADFFVDDIKLVKLSDSKLDINGDGVSDILDLVQFKNNGYSSELKAELRTVILAQ